MSNVFPHDRTPIYRNIPRRNPIFQLSQSAVINETTCFQPRLHEFLGGDGRVDPVGVVDDHKDSLPQHKAGGKLPARNDLVFPHPSPLSVEP